MSKHQILFRWKIVLSINQQADLLPLPDHHILDPAQFIDFLPQGVICAAALAPLGIFQLELSHIVDLRL